MSFHKKKTNLHPSPLGKTKVIYEEAQANIGQNPICRQWTIIRRGKKEGNEMEMSNIKNNNNNNITRGISQHMPVVLSNRVVVSFVLSHVIIDIWLQSRTDFVVKSPHGWLWYRFTAATLQERKIFIHAKDDLSISLPLSIITWTFFFCCFFYGNYVVSPFFVFELDPMERFNFNYRSFLLCGSDKFPSCFSTVAVKREVEIIIFFVLKRVYLKYKDFHERFLGLIRTKKGFPCHHKLLSQSHACNVIKVLCN